MMRRRIVGSLVIVGLSCAGSAVSPAATEKTARSHSMIYKPAIEYPYAARKAGITGSGVVAVEIDNATGKVTRAYMLKSTGSRILDDAALSAFRNARFAGTFHAPVKIPITFGGRPPRRH